MTAQLSYTAAPLSTLLGLPAELLFWAGLSLFPVAAFLLWVAGSALVLVLLSPTGLGYAFVIAQAAVVALLAELEYVGLKRI